MCGSWTGEEEHRTQRTAMLVDPKATRPPFPHVPPAFSSPASPAPHHVEGLVLIGVGTEAGWIGRRAARKNRQSAASRACGLQEEAQPRGMGTAFAHPAPHARMARSTPVAHVLLEQQLGARGVAEERGHEVHFGKIVHWREVKDQGGGIIKISSRQGGAMLPPSRPALKPERMNQTVGRCCSHSQHCLAMARVATYGCSPAGGTGCGCRTVRCRRRT